MPSTLFKTHYGYYNFYYSNSIPNAIFGGCFVRRCATRQQARGRGVRFWGAAASPRAPVAACLLVGVGQPNGSNNVQTVWFFRGFLWFGFVAAWF